MAPAERAMATVSPAAAEALDLERIRASFPTLSRRDRRTIRSPTSTRAPARSACSPRSRPSTATSAATTRTSTAARTRSRPRRPRPTRARGRPSPTTSAPPTGASWSSSATRPRRSTWSPAAWGDANVGAGDRIVLTEMEHHSNIVPWQQLAERAGRRDRLGRRSTTTARCSATSSRRRWPASRSCSRSPTSPTCSARSTRSPRSPTLAHAAGALVARRRRAGGAEAAASTSPSSGSTSTPSPATRPTGRPGSARSGARLELLREMPPFLGGGSMIRKVTREGTTYADPPARFEAGTPAIAQAIGLAAALRWLDAIGMDAALAHEREITAYALAALAEVPGLRVFGPPAERGPRRPGLVRARGRPRPRRRRDPRPPRRRRPRRPPLRPAADAAPRAWPRPPAPASASTRREARDRPARRRPARRPPASSGSETDGRALPRSDPRALQAARTTSAGSTPSTSTTRTPTRFCGDEQHVFIKLDDDGRVSEVSFEGQGCAISTAATSLLTDELDGHDAARSSCACRRSTSSTCSGSRSRRPG